MRRIHFKGFLLGTLLSVTTLAVRADDWPGPQTKEVFSASREYFVRVIPGESLGDTFGFAGEKEGKICGGRVLSPPSGSFLQARSRGRPSQSRGASRVLC